MNKNLIKNLINAAALLVAIAGAFGMLFCLPFLFSNKIIDVVGAGLPFVAGAILVGLGLIAFAINNRRE